MKAEQWSSAFRDENNSEATAFSLISGADGSGTMCAADADFFRFIVAKAGTVSVAVTATDTPLRVTLTSAATAPVTADIPAGSTQTLSTEYTGSTVVTFNVKVETLGAVGPTAAYTVRPTYPFDPAPKRRRAVAR